MARIDGKQAAQEHLIEVAKSVVQAVYKAPLTTGRLKARTEIVTGEDLVPFIETLGELAKVSQFIRWDYMTLKENYEAGNPPVLVLIGADSTQSDLAWNCGACGFPTCKEFNAYAKENRGRGVVTGGPTCNWKALDLGIACDWAAAAAYQQNVDNRVQGSTGCAAEILGYLPGCSSVIGLSLGPCKELVWYSREVMNRKFSYTDHINTMFRTLPSMFMGFAGGGNPVLKTSDKWWEQQNFLSWGTLEAANEILTEVFTEIGKIAGKYGPQIAEKYK